MPTLIMLSLNMGCGGSSWGDVRLDISKAGAPTIIADAHFLPFKDGSFESTLASHVLEHLNQPWEALKEIMRVTNQKIELRFPSAGAEFWNFFLDGLATSYFRRAHEHKWIINPEMTASHLRMNNWHIERYERDTLPLLLSLGGGRKARLFRFFTRHSPKTPFPGQYFITASKQKE